MESTLDKTIDNFLKLNGITFTLSAVNADGETLARYTSDIDASDVSAYAGLLDEAILNMAIEDLRHKEDYDE